MTRTRHIGEESLEKKRYRLQTAYLISEFLLRISSLRELSLKSNRIGDEGLIEICKALNDRHCCIEKLDLSHTGMTSDSFRKISLLRNQHLKTLILDRNNLSTTWTFSPIAQIMSSSHLQSLSLKECFLLDSFGIAFSEALRNNRTLQKFNFFDN